MKLRLIPPGEFEMGSPEAEIDALVQFTPNPNFQAYFRSEGPQHRVQLTKAFYLGSCEVTQRQYQELIGVNPSHFCGTGPGKYVVKDMDTGQHPVERVNWYDAIGFCNKLSEKEQRSPYYVREGEAIKVLGGTGYRLPTEAEWEYACRAGTTTSWSFGDDKMNLAQHAWWNAVARKRTHRVGELLANPFGLYDLYGNVSEWCWDWHGEYTAVAVSDPTGSSAGTVRVLRGGSSHDAARWARSAYRCILNPAARELVHGFRLARTIDSKIEVSPLASTGGSEARPKESDGWVPLFNGKDLANWYKPEQNKGTWDVVDGMLVGRGGGAGGQAAWIASRRRDFADFQLRLELTRPVRAHVILRAPAEGGHPYGWDGYGVALVNGTTPAGQVFDAGALRKSVGWPISWTVPAMSVPLPQGPYSVEIHVSGRTITSFVEGTKVAEYDDAENVFTSGEIRFYCGYDSELRFQRIDLKE